MSMPQWLVIAANIRRIQTIPMIVPAREIPPLDILRNLYERKLPEIPAKAAEKV